MLKDVREIRCLRFHECLEYISRCKIKNQVFRSSVNPENKKFIVDELGNISIQGNINIDDVFISETKITEFTTLKKCVILLANGEIVVDTEGNRNVHFFKEYYGNNFKSLHALVNGNLELVWENEYLKERCL